MTHDFMHNNEYHMKCSKDEPCFCYGRICLTGSQKCSEGNVIINGSAVCGAKTGWDKKFAGYMTCNDLGFKDVLETTVGRCDIVLIKCPH